MSLLCKQIEHLEEWEAFVQSQQQTVFLQSITNGTVHEALGGQWWVFGLYEHGELIGGSIVLGVQARRGSFLLLPYGPIVNATNKGKMACLLDALRIHAKNNGYHFIRFSPYVESSAGYLAMLAELGARKAPMHVLAEHTYVLNLSESEQRLLAHMNKNHRNLIRRCEREGVVVAQTTSADALARLNDMLDVIEVRHKFTRFPRAFVDAECLHFAKKGEAVLFEATLPDGRVDASAMIIFYGNMACYRHSASLQQESRLPTPYLIQWHVIQEAKRRGMQWYNFWGVAPEGAKSTHPFYGITHFKKGFGGELHHLVPCHDVPVTRRYWLTWGIETLRRIRRGF